MQSDTRIRTPLVHKHGDGRSPHPYLKSHASIRAQMNYVLRFILYMGKKKTLILTS